MKLSDTIYATEKHKNAKDVILIIIGTVLFSIYAGLLIPVNNIGAGGALGLSLVVNKLTGIKIGTIQFILNVPLFYIGYRYIGRKFVILTGVVISISSFLINNLPKIITPVNLGDSLVAAIFCGIISGLAMCCLLVAGASTGGTDITGKFISKKMDFNLPTVFLIQDITVYTIVWIFFDIKYVMYALVMSFVRNQTMRGVQKFFSAYIQCTIICKNPEVMVELINNTLHRGSTIMDVEGGYSHEKKRMIIVVIQQNEMYQLRKLVAKNCPEAFITVSAVNTIVGNFKEHSYRL
ncbi:YitT family protein [uncultured Gemella sp.]|uniref:YitT family protein n=1 Tax=uncultured Gemella sp. TaxID=254352 RepID=UPI0028D36DBD|nr:YitT family protein [uncultured Gemella sp.]